MSDGRCKYVLLVACLFLNLLVVLSINHNYYFVCIICLKNLDNWRGNCLSYTFFILSQVPVLMMYQVGCFISLVWFASPWFEKISGVAACYPNVLIELEMYLSSYIYNWSGAYLQMDMEKKCLFNIGRIYLHLFSWILTMWYVLVRVCCCSYGDIESGWSFTTVTNLMVAWTLNTYLSSVSCFVTYGRVPIRHPA